MESFGGLERINLVFIISNGKNDFIFEQVASQTAFGNT